METFEHRHSTVLVIAQHGPGDKPFFGFVNTRTTWADYENKLHHTVARLVAIEQGCAPKPMVCCDIEDLPRVIGAGIATVGHDYTLPAYDVKPHHYEQARQLVDQHNTLGRDEPAEPPTGDTGTAEGAMPQFTLGTETYDDGERITVTARHLPDALHKAAQLIDGFTISRATKVVVGNTLIKDEHGDDVPLYGVGIEYERSE